MNIISILIDCIIILQKELVIENKLSNITIDLVKTTLHNLRCIKSKSTLSQDPNVILPNIIYKILENPNNYLTSVNLINELRMLLKKDVVCLKVIEDNILNIKDKKVEQQIIEGIRTKLANNNKALVTKNKITDIAKILNNSEMTDEAIFNLGMDLKNKLNDLSISRVGKEPGVVGVLNLNSERSVDEALDRLKIDNSNIGILKTGWYKVNRMLQGGFRRGEMCAVYALQHNYKSGFCQSIFMQIARHNKPVLTDETKKPLLLYVSLEDELKNVLNFMYKYLYYNENQELPKDEKDIKNLTGVELFKYINERLHINGYHTLIMRVNPSEWTYLNLISTIEKLEAKGYELHLCVVDYLSKLPTEYCNKSGAAGTDIRDLFDKVRNYMSEHRICCITPHQLGPRAKALLENIPASKIVDHVANKGMTEGSSQLDQVLDVEINIHKAMINHKPWLTMKRGKHRGTDIIDDKYLYVKLPFPPHAPIMENLNETDEVDDTNENESLTDMFGI